MSNSQNTSKFMFITKKNRLHSESLAYNEKKGISKFQSIRFDSFHVSDLNVKLNQLCPILKIHQNVCL